MTYVSRKTRIIISSWPDECSAEYLFQSFRKRSDGRLKNYSSCDDLRAWVNDNCVKNEYLLDLMTKNEFLGEPPFALYGRYIPVPILFKLLGNSIEKDKEKESGGKESEQLNRIQWEKDQAEKNLLECTCLLNSAVRRLEKLDSIIEVANSETQISKAKEIKKAFRAAREVCNCSDCRNSSVSSVNNNAENDCSSPDRKLKDLNTYNEVVRKISQLKKIIEEIQICRCRINQILKAQNSVPSCQLKQLYNREDQDLIKKQQKELKKLIADKERLFYEICHVLNPSKSLKTSKNNFNERRGYQSMDKSCGTSNWCSQCKNEEKGFDTYESTDAENTDCMEQSNGYNDTNNHKNEYPCEYSEPPERLSSCRDEEPEKLYDDMNCGETHEISLNNSCGNYATPPEPSNRDIRSDSSQRKFQKIKNSEEKKDKSKKSSVKFICDISPCAKKSIPNELSEFESSLTEEQKEVIAKAVESIQNLRPSTSPTTEKEKKALAVKSDSPNQSINMSDKNGSRRVKSETMIKEFNKTLKNYELRLKNLGMLESKVENLKQKSSEAYRLRRKLAKVKAEAKKHRAAERDKFNSEITRLCFENRELKTHIQQLSDKYEAQCKKIQILKRSVMRSRELECETEELKKELTKYRNGCEHQRKCISKWENVVAMQRTEIENLMNRIRKLTAVKEEAECPSYQEKKYIQRSRSYSPEIGKEKSRRRVSKEYRLASEEEETGCCCGEHPQREVEEMKKIQQTSMSRCCFPPTNESIHRKFYSWSLIKASSRNP